MIGSIYIASLRHNDNGMQNMSGLNDYLLSILTPISNDNGRMTYPAVYGDSIFTVLACIVRPFQNPNREQQIINVRFSSLRESIEHKFADIFGLFRVLRMSWRHILVHQGNHVRKMFFTILFVSNCHNCFNESRNLHYGLRAPTIMQYLPLNEVLTAAPAGELGETIRYF